MTKDAYFEMCETLGSEPVDSEIPVDYEDLYIDVQEALGIYQKLKDEWDTMNGNYMGKSYNGILDIFTILEIPTEDHKTLLELISIIDKHRSKAIADSKPKTSK
ncbi:MAG: hypothetical protein QX189_20030 [Methylococcales bacterium]